jgi:hypothetical protein
MAERKKTATVVVVAAVCGSEFSPAAKTAQAPPDFFRVL